MEEYVMQETYRLKPSFLIPTMNNAHVERMGIFLQGSGSEKHNSLLQHQSIRRTMN